MANSSNLSEQFNLAGELAKSKLPQNTAESLPITNANERDQQNSRDFAKPNISRLELEREQLKETRRQAEIARVRQQIMQLNQATNNHGLELSSQIRLDLQQAQNNLDTNSDYLGKTTLSFYDLLIRKARQKAAQSSTSSGSSPGSLSQADKLLQFNQGSGENDSQQKAA